MWYWDYRLLGTDDSDKAHFSLRPRQSRQQLRESTFGEKHYWHCPRCNNGYYDIDVAHTCCGDVRRVMRYEARQAVIRQQKRWSIVLDLTAMV